MSGLALAWRLARRELRGGLGGFVVFFACLTLGVAAIVTVGGLRPGLTRGRRAGRLGAARRRPHDRGQQPAADRGRARAALTPPRRHRAGDTCAPTPWPKPATAGGWRWRSRRSTPPSPSTARRCSIRRPRASIAALADQGVVVERSLLARLGLAVGDRLRIGAGRVRDPRRARARAGPDRRLRQHRAARDDRPRSAGARPRIILPGSLARYSLSAWRCRRASTPTPGWRRSGSAHPDARWRARGTRDVQPQVTRFTDRLATYLTLAGLTALLIGGVGVGARDPELSGRQDHDHRHAEVPGRLERPGVPDLPAAGPGAGRARQPARPRDRAGGALAAERAAGAGCCRSRS